MRSYTSRSRSRDKGPTEPWPRPARNEEQGEAQSTDQAPVLPPKSPSARQPEPNIDRPSEHVEDNEPNFDDVCDVGEEEDIEDNEPNFDDVCDVGEEEDNEEELVMQVSSGEDDSMATQNDSWYTRNRSETSERRKLKDSMNNYPEGHWWEWSYKYDRFVTIEGSKMWSIWFTAQSNVDFYWYVVLDFSYASPY